MVRSSCVLFGVGVLGSCVGVARGQQEDILYPIGTNSDLSCGDLSYSMNSDQTFWEISDKAGIPEYMRCEIGFATPAKVKGVADFDNCSVAYLMDPDYEKYCSSNPFPESGLVYGHSAADFTYKVKGHASGEGMKLEITLQPGAAWIQKGSEHVLLSVESSGKYALSPRGTRTYGPNEDATVKFVGPAEVEFQMFNMEESSNCSKDFVMIGDYKYCGDEARHNVTFYDEGVFTINYHSDGDTDGSDTSLEGFMLFIYPHESNVEPDPTPSPDPNYPPGPPAPVKTCSATVEVLASSVYPASRMEPFDYSWTMTSDVNVRIVRVDLDGTDTKVDCSASSIEIKGEKYCNLLKSSEQKTVELSKGDKIVYHAGGWKFGNESRSGYRLEISPK